ncbi:MAG: acyl-CoA dehydrogenase, partial [Rhodococcus sp. (in: high G+C Gram-positive bacteria)]
MRFTREQREFAVAVREFCDAECKTLQQRDLLTDGGTLANSTVILDKFAGLGWLAVSLPEEYGGGGAGMVEECIFLEESARGLAPITGYSTGLTAAQTYLRYGTEDQKHTIVGNMAAGKLEAIALSEPGAGSDLGGVRIKAELVDDHYVVNGQKTWISAAHVAEHILLLARTDSSGNKHQGLTLFMVPTDAPGLQIHEIKTMEARTCNDLYFTDVAVPVSAVVGTPNQAWRHLMRGLSVERLIIATMALGAAQRSLDDVIA